MRLKSKRVDKRTMVAIQNNSDSFGSESEDEQITNLCLIARQNSGENDESKEATLEYLLTLSNKYLAPNMLKCEKFE